MSQDFKEAFERLRLAVVLASDTCVAADTKIVFVQKASTRISNCMGLNAKKANDIITEAAREVCPLDRRDDLEDLLITHGFIERSRFAISVIGYEVNDSNRGIVRTMMEAAAAKGVHVRHLDNTEFPCGETVTVNAGKKPYTFQASRSW